MVIQNIPINTVDIEDIFLRYFQALPPFSAKKKDEIPDAVTLNALEKWFHQKNEACYVISTDSDMKKYCEENQELNYLNSVDSLLDIITSEDASRYQNVMEIFEKSQFDVLDLVKENLFDQTFELSSLDGTVEEVSIGEVNFSDEPLITEIGGDFSKISFHVSFDYVASCSIFDDSASPYDSESKGYLWKEYSDETFSGHLDVPVEVLMTNIDFKQLVPEDVDIEDITVNNNETMFIETWYDYD